MNHTHARNAAVRSVGYLIATLVAVARAPAAAPPPEDVTAVLVDCVRGPATARQLEAIAGLRVLRDPALQPLLGYLASHERADFRAQGILGLAEISPDRRVAVPLIARIADPVEQAAVIGQALRLELLGAEEIAELAEWPRLDPSIEAVLWSKLSVRSPESVDLNRLSELARDEDTIAAVLAMQALAQRGDARIPAAMLRRLKALPDDQRLTVGRIALERIALDGLSSSGALSPIWTELFSGEDSLREPLLAAMMVADSERGGAEWRRQYQESADLGRRLVLAGAALNVLDSADASVIQTLREDPDRLLSLIGRAAGAVREKRLDDPALLELASSGHPPSTAWLIRALRGTDSSIATEIRLRIIERALDAEGPPTRPMASIIADAVREQSQHDPAALRRVIERACAARRSEALALILGSAVASASGPLWPEDAEPTWPDSQCSILAVMLRARTGGALTPEQVDRLILAARGGERLDPARRAQAAWIVLSAGGNAGSALALALGARDGGGEANN